MSLRFSAISFLLGAVNIAVAQIEPFCRCTCNMRPLVPEVVCSTEDLSTLCKAVSSLPDVAEALSRTDLKYTVFAPNDAGWGNLMLIHDNLLDEPEVLTNLLLNHVVVGFEPICSEDLVCGNLLFMANSSEKGQRTKTACSFSESPPQGDDAKPEDGEEPTAIYQKGDRNGSSKGNMPEIIGPDTRAKNGVIHIINNVILQKDSFPGEDADDDQAPPSDDDQAPSQCTGGKACGECKGECQNNDGCRFSKVGWCKRDCEERFGNPDTCLCEGGGGDDDQQPAKSCCGAFDCHSCQEECAVNEGCGRESTAECQTYCEEKWGGCQCTGGTDCGSCKSECQNNDGCRFSKTGYCKRDCEERFGDPETCLCGSGGDDQPAKVCCGGDSCGSCKRECQDNEGCGRESTGECKGYCQQKWGPC